MYDNLKDINRFAGGTIRFTFDGIACAGHIAAINYIPIGPGGINVTLVSLITVSDAPLLGPSIPDIPLDFTFSLMLAEVSNNARELIINQLVPPDHFGPIVSFRMRD